MELKNLESLYKNKKLKEKLEQIQILIDDNKNKEAYFKLAAILEYMNVKLLTKKLGEKLLNYNIEEIIKKYYNKDEFLFKKMQSVNGMYNFVSGKEINVQDVVSLGITIDYIYEYMIEKYGEFI